MGGRRGRSASRRRRLPYSDAEVEQVIVFDGGFAVGGPGVADPGVGVWLIEEGPFVRKALPARVDAVADHFCPLGNARLVVHTLGVVDTATLDTQHCTAGRAAPCPLFPASPCWYWRTSRAAPGDW